MSKIVEISDSSGHSFKINITRDIMPPCQKNWRSIDKGCIKINSGKADIYGQAPHQHLELVGPDNTTGIQLYDWRGHVFNNDEGIGNMQHAWVLNFDAGRISWVLVD